VENDGLVTTLTMAKIYLRQGYWGKAAAVYRQLLKDSPDSPGLIQGLRVAEDNLCRRTPESVARVERLIREWLRLLLTRRNLRRLNILKGRIKAPQAPPNPG
jgi:hypothetical protein